MKLSILGGLVVWASVSAAMAEEVVREFSWADYRKAGEVQPGGPSGPAEELKIDRSKTDVPDIVTVFDVTNPSVTTSCYAVEGRVRYENVTGKSYLEMWSWFPDGSRHFSRTLADSGPLQHLEGSSDWRPFTLPFFGSPKEGLPKRLVVNVAFAGRGTVYLSPLKLVQYPTPLVEALRQRFDTVGWWSDRSAGLIGGIGGSIVGLLGGLIGTLAGLGKARRFVLTLTAALIGTGVLSLVVGVVALALGQPYAVHYPLLLLGVILTAVCGGNLPGLRRRYEQIELRKMAAMDTR